MYATRPTPVISLAPRKMPPGPRKYSEGTTETYVTLPGRIALGVQT